MNRLRLDTERPLREAVPDALRRLTDAIGQGIANESADFDEAIHGARTSLKKLRALLRLLGSTLSPEAFRDLDHQVRDFARQLGGVRDAAVMLATFRQIRDDAALYLKQTATLAIDTALRRQYEQALRTRDPARLHETLVPQFGRLRQAIAALDTSGLDQGRIVEAVEQVYRDGLHGYRSAQTDPDDERSHAWRKSVKYLWYQLQLLAPPACKPLKRLCRKLDHLGDTLGRAHDLVVLSAYLHHHGLLRDPTHEAIVQGLISGRQHALVEDALAQANDVYGARPGAFADWLRQSLNDA